MANEAPPTLSTCSHSAQILLSSPFPTQLGDTGQGFEVVGMPPRQAAPGPIYCTVNIGAHPPASPPELCPAPRWSPPTTFPRSRKLKCCFLPQIKHICHLRLHSGQPEGDSVSLMLGSEKCLLRHQPSICGSKLSGTLCTLSPGLHLGCLLNGIKEAALPSILLLRWSHTGPYTTSFISIIPAFSRELPPYLPLFLRLDDLFQLRKFRKASRV